MAPLAFLLPRKAPIKVKGVTDFLLRKLTPLLTRIFVNSFAGSF